MSHDNHGAGTNKAGSDQAKRPIRDRGYTRYDGPRLPPRKRYRVLAGRTLQIAWKHGLVKTVLILAMFPMVVCAVVMYLKIKGAQMLAAQGMAQMPEVVLNPEHWIFNCVYWCQIWFGFCISLLVGAPAIAEDVRSGAFQFYFSRPINKSHYIVGKALAVAALISVVTAIPGLLLVALRIALGKGESIGSMLLLLPYTLGFSVLLAAVLTLPPIALSSLARRAGPVMGGWAALFFIPWVLGEATASATDKPVFAAISIATDLRLVGQQMFGIEPSYDLPIAASLGALLLLIAGSVLILWRRLSRVEVFA